MEVMREIAIAQDEDGWMDGWRWMRMRKVCETNGK
jgi:hypothetical protein